MLRHGSVLEKQRMFQQLQKEAESLVQSCIAIAYFMRGAIQYDDVLLRCHAERELFSEFINERFEQEKKHSFPVY